MCAASTSSVQQGQPRATASERRWDALTAFHPRDHLSFRIISHIKDELKANRLSFGLWFYNSKGGIFGHITLSIF